MHAILFHVTQHIHTKYTKIYFFHKKNKPHPVKIVSQIDRQPYTKDQIKITLKLEFSLKNFLEIIIYALT